MSEKVNALQIMQEAFDNCKATDCGALGKAFEIATRAFIQPKSKRTTVTKAGKWYGDILTRRNNETLRIEVKTACGELAIVDTLDFNIDDLLPKADLVIYCPEVTFTVKPEQQGFVFTREQFLEMLDGYNGSGSLLRVKPATNGGYRVSLQSFLSDSRPKASKKIAEYIWDNCYEMPTVEELYGIDE